MRKEARLFTRSARPAADGGSSDHTSRCARFESFLAAGRARRRRRRRVTATTSPKLEATSPPGNTNRCRRRWHRHYRVGRSCRRRRVATTTIAAAQSAVVVGDVVCGVNEEATRLGRLSSRRSLWSSPRAVESPIIGGGGAVVALMFRYTLRLTGRRRSVGRPRHTRSRRSDSGDARVRVRRPSYRRSSCFERLVATDDETPA